MFSLKSALEFDSPTALLRPAPKLGQFGLGTTKWFRLFHAASLTTLWSWSRFDRIYPSQTPFILNNGLILTHEPRGVRLRKPRGLNFFPKGIHRYTGCDVQQFGTSRDGQFIAISGLNQELELWNLKRKKRLHTGEGGFYLREFHPHNKCVVTESKNSDSLLIFGLPSGKLLSHIPLPGELGGWGTGHQRLAFDSYGDTFWVLTRQGLLQVNWREGRCQQTKIRHSSKSVNLHHGRKVIPVTLDGILGLALSPNNKRLALAVNDEIRLFSLGSHGELELEQTIPERAFSLTFADDSHLALTTSESGPKQPKLVIYATS